MRVVGQAAEATAIDVPTARPPRAIRRRSRRTTPFPGDNSWAAMFRPVVKGRARHATHRGIDECRSFAERFVAEGIQFGEPEDILVNGPPWRTRVAVRVHDFKPGPLAASDGSDDVYSNRAVAFLELRWGKIVRWEDYEDTERIAAWDAARTATVTASPAAGAERSSN